MPRICQMSTNYSGKQRVGYLQLVQHLKKSRVSSKFNSYHLLDKKNISHPARGSKFPRNIPPPEKKKEKENSGGQCGFRSAIF